MIKYILCHQAGEGDLHLGMMGIDLGVVIPDVTRPNPRWPKCSYLHLPNGGQHPTWC